ncbi:MAG: hypothetical protein HC848_04235 [Limnobacter sp.]|nr:hypothetical protein [Limnobacter sp.]
MWGALAWLGSHFDFKTEHLKTVQDYPFTHDDLFCGLMLTFEVESEACPERTRKLRAYSADHAGAP